MSRTIINGQYSFNYLPTQWLVLKAIESMIPNITFVGGYGNGKTRFGGEIGLEISCAYPGAEITYWRKTLTSNLATDYRMFQELVMPPEYIKDHERSRHVIIDRNGTRYDWLGIDRATRKGSYWCDVAIIDEGIELEEEEYKMIEGRLRSKHLPKPLLITLTNAGSPGAYVYKNLVMKGTQGLPEYDPDYACFTATSFENIHNPQAYFDRLNKWRGTKYFNRKVLALWEAMKGLVYESWDAKKHLIDPFPIPKEWRKTIGLDFGFDHPLVMLWIAEDPLTQRKYVYRQYYKTRTLVRNAVKIAKRTGEKTGEKYERIWADHDAEGRAQFDNDWPQLKISPANKEVQAGIQTIEELLLPQTDGQPGLYVFNDSWNDKEPYWYGNLEVDPVLEENNQPINLQQEMDKYKWGKDDKPLKLFDDAVDALRYDLHSERTYEESGEIQVYTGHSFGRR